MYLIAWPGGSWEATLKYAVTIVALYVAVMWLALVFWTYRDIRQRTRDPIVQTVAVLLVLAFFLPGLWVYLILRPRMTLAEAYERSLEEEALLQELEDQKACPSCKRRVHDEFLVCPSCTAQLKEPCRSCSKPLSYAWVVCPFCGLSKAPREQSRPRQRPAQPPAQRPAAAQPTGPIQAQPAPAMDSRAARSAAITEIGPLPQQQGQPWQPSPGFPQQSPGQRPPVRVAMEEGPLIDATRD